MRSAVTLEPSLHRPSTCRTKSFVSHSSVERPFVNELVAVLRRHGVPVWYSETNIRGAQQWHDEIGAALRRCDWFALVLSPDAVASKWVKRELLYSLLQDRFEGRIASLRCCIGPVLTMSCPGLCPRCR